MHWASVERACPMFARDPTQPKPERRPKAEPQIAPGRPSKAVRLVRQAKRRRAGVVVTWPRRHKAVAQLGAPMTRLRQNFGGRAEPVAVPKVGAARYLQRVCDPVFRHQADRPHPCARWAPARRPMSAASRCGAASLRGWQTRPAPKAARLHTAATRWRRAPTRRDGPSTAGKSGPTRAKCRRQPAGASGAHSQSSP